MAASRLAKGLFHQIGRVPGGTRFLAGGGKDLIRQSVPGSVITAGLTTLATGNPIAGLLVGGTDLALSAGLARGLATNRATNVARKMFPGQLISEYERQGPAPRSGLAPPVLIFQTSPSCNIFIQISRF